MKRVIASLALAFCLSGCTGVTPYPTFNPIFGAQVSANPYQPGTRRFCREYARQTAGNAYSNRVDREDGDGLITAEFARRDGQVAYRRCLARNGLAPPRR